MRFLILVVMLLTIGGATLAAQPAALLQVKHMARYAITSWSQGKPRLVNINRAHNGDFELRAKVNGVAAPMVIDTGATSVVLTYEAASAAGLPLDLANYDVDLETAGGRVRAARVTLDRVAVGKLVELSVPALVVPRGQLRTSLLGMSFLNRLESWEVRPDTLILRGYP
ncbi:MAG: TIGR02281 family clan AA aspartic protease [Xanthobacteraceae bacterium]|nr:TIGR02281 family clan AA aspartic protease [Xanthobacteraceae bacterium]